MCAPQFGFNAIAGTVLASVAKLGTVYDTALLKRL